MKKVTKKEFYQELINYFKGDETAFELTENVVIEFCEKEIAALEKKAESAKKSAAKRKAKNDVLTDYVKDALTDEFASIADITDIIEDVLNVTDEVDIEVTPSKVTYRLTALVKDGFAEKQAIDVEGTDGKKRKIQGYRLATETVEAED